VLRLPLVFDDRMRRLARDYLNASIDSWLPIYYASYSTSVTPEDGTDVSSRVRSNVFGPLQEAT
jgi:hypothetical protein